MQFDNAHYQPLIARKRFAPLSGWQTLLSQANWDKLNGKDDEVN